jgi:arginine-tRNA-protein transferase
MSSKPAQYRFPVTFQDSSDCPYFEDGRISTVEFLLPDHGDQETYHLYLAKGYRRIGKVFYHNVCDGCSECLPLRIDTSRFSPSRSQKRTLRKNRDMIVKIVEYPSVTEEKILLYSRYLKSKHNSDSAERVEESMSMLYNIHYGYPRSIEMDYYLRDRLVGVGIVDEADDSLSSNYFYYDTSCLPRRPGVFSILTEISLAGRLGKKYYYLGFYIKDNPRMSYKGQFRPAQVLFNGRWEQTGFPFSSIPDLKSPSRTDSSE